jgi:hypothetical protein
MDLACGQIHSASFSVSNNTNVRNGIEWAAQKEVLKVSSSSELTSETGQLQTTVNVRELDAESC